ncbi:sodium ion-translocating decarboxylase subunit beta [Brassicibacter mesophilus]|uniref:sodium ion-translocating decarboxylase subunit beta n=1 Tax=Brassicibacter mesophilus TaxID=745119 RepID=UPI003D22C134
MKKGKLTKVVTIFTIITAIITLSSAVFSLLIPLYLSYKLQKDLSGASSIGIIGGTDGPTAIFLASQPSSHLITFIFALLTIGGVVYLIYSKKAMK